jgi:hypothetical protein
MHTFCSPVLIHCLLKVKTRVYIPKMTKDRQTCLLCLFLQCDPGPVVNLLSLPLTMSVYLVHRTKWPDLTSGSPKIWDLGPKFGFQCYRQEASTPGLYFNTASSCCSTIRKSLSNLDWADYSLFQMIGLKYF